MSLAGAFHHEETLRNSLLEELKAEDTLRQQWFGDPFDAGTVETLASRYGIAPVMMYLVRQLVIESGAEPTAFVQDLVRAIAPGSSILDIVRRWYVWSWREASHNLSGKLVQPDLNDAGTAIADLVNDSMVRAVSPREWRSARGALGRMDDGSGPSNPFVEPVLSMAWDLADVPGSAGDMVTAWSLGIRQEINLARGWTPELREKLNDCSIATHFKALAALGIDNREQLPERGAELHDRFCEMLRSDPEGGPLLMKHEECERLVSAAKAEWLSEVSRGLVMSAVDLQLAH